ncbi:protein-L-isoaspartate(D-aspartate) O-methyltransferase [Rhizobium halophytocola]|uniref:Protein-L-isoaspartate O-methyltransferase n=1 Tax=Rhizobium halophytocola TaxID=735519 RepID=A0ABS4DW00_9HYPH|nr:protein-L-isoaspartate(D-aspartate) O-methyltransferase [Rhizobium halophytocola]
MIEREGFAALVLRLRAEGISDLDLLTAVEQTPRSAFVPSYLAEHAYSSRSIPLDCGSFMEGADLTVRMLRQLNVKPAHRVLEIGTGSGFMAAVLGRMSERVLSLERYRGLATDAQKRIDDLGLKNVVVRLADGSAGVTGEGTFDRIIATAAFPEMPRFMAEQMASGGVAVVPVIVDEGRCMLTRLAKTGSRFEREELGPVPFLPLEPRLSLCL